jgi:hypothetical protein
MAIPASHAAVYSPTRPEWLLNLAAWVLAASRVLECWAHAVVPQPIADMPALLDLARQNAGDGNPALERGE